MTDPNLADGAPMRLYDTARRAVVPFEPGHLVTMYTCGITPYDATHLGHAATYVTYDVLQRRLRDRGHETRCVRNITDVDDDMLRKAKELGVHYLDLAAAETARFDNDMLALERHHLVERAPGDVRHRRHPRVHRDGARPGPRLHQRWLRLLRRQQLRALRAGVALLARRDARPRPRARRQPRRPEQARPSRFRALAAVGRGRAGLGVAVGPGSAGLAHRVLGAGPARARHHHRPPRRRLRPDLPAPRVRGGPERGGHRAARSCATGCTRPWSAWTARRCRSRWATSCSSATC